MRCIHQSWHLDKSIHTHTYTALHLHVYTLFHASAKWPNVVTLASYSERSFESLLHEVCCRVALSWLTQADSFIKLNENHRGTEAQLRSPCKGSHANYSWTWRHLEAAPDFRRRRSNELAKEPNGTCRNSRIPAERELARCKPAPSCGTFAGLDWSGREKLGESQKVRLREEESRMSATESQRSVDLRLQINSQVPQLHLG